MVAPGHTGMGGSTLVIKRLDKTSYQLVTNLSERKKLRKKPWVSKTENLQQVGNVLKYR
jgi:hypothetical protein